ncbi:MAG: LLM class flavin-dependent oxidoreductase [Chloroflexi bacterium]|nr:LLM class flavin-dependent oxidoreductase [Chloroflexota bacterium]
MSQRLRFGINILQNLPYEQLVERWQKVDELGFDSLWGADHFGLRMHPEGIWFNGWTLLAAMATVTKRVRIGLAVTSPTQHNPAMLAKRAMTVDHISGGRLELGIGAGGVGSAWEEEMIGVTSSWTAGQRVERFREFVEIVDTMLRNPKSNYEGKYYKVKDALMIPSPVQKPRPPLTIAAHGTKSLKIAAQYADTWNSFGKGFVSETECFEAARQQMEQLDEYCAELGRDPKEIRRSFYPFGSHRYGVSLQAFYDFVEPYREIGFTEFILTWLPKNVLPNVDDNLIMSDELLEQIAAEAIPKLRSED